MNTPASPPTVVMTPTVIGEAGQTAQSVIHTLGAQPVLLVIVILNIAMCAAAGWFLLTQENYRHVERMQFMTLVERCMVGAKTP